MFSAVLGLATSFMGASQANRQANMQYQMHMDQMQQQRDMQGMMLMQASQARRDQSRENEYLRQLEERNRDQRETERLFQIDEMRAFQDQLMEERQREVERQIQADREAARIQAFNLEQLTRNQRISEQERQFAIQQLEEAQRIAAGERDEEMRRFYEDRARAEAEREFAIEEMRRHQQIAAQERADDMQRYLDTRGTMRDERAEAMGLLRDARDTASQERREDQAQFEQTRRTQELEREFLREQYENALRHAGQEQEMDLALRDRITGQIDNMGRALQEAQASFGPAPEMPQLSMADIDREIRRRGDAYQSDVDRAADRVASINEADLIRSGIGSSTTGTAARGDVAARLSQEYQNARNRAYDDALAYITGRTNALSANVGDQMQHRGSQLQEIMGVHGAGMDALLQMPGYTSVADAHGMAQMVPSAAYDRNIRSANDFSAPIQVGSAAYDRDIRSAMNYNVPMGIGSTIIDRAMPSANAYSSPVGLGSAIYESGQYTMTPGMSNAQIGTSGATPAIAGAQSAIMDPYTMALENPGAYIGPAANIGTNMLSATGNMFNNAQARADQAGSVFGANLNDFALDHLSPLFGGAEQHDPFTPQHSGMIAPMPLPASAGMPPPPRPAPPPPTPGHNRPPDFRVPQPPLLGNNR